MMQSSSNEKSEIKKLKIKTMSNDGFENIKQTSDLKKFENDNLKNTIDTDDVPEKRNYFFTVPDEIVLKIFSYIDQFKLKLSCSVVCKRFNKLSEDISLWKETNYVKTNIELKVVRKLIILGIEKLDFSKSILEKYAPLFTTRFNRLSSFKRFSKLQYLHLDNTVAPRSRFEEKYRQPDYKSRFVEDILSVCSCIKVLKLCGISINRNIVHHISENKTIQELYWISCTFALKTYSDIIFWPYSLTNLGECCKDLKIIDFDCTQLSGQDITMLFSNISPHITTLILYISEFLEYRLNELIKQIINRCPNITHLKIGYLGCSFYSVLVEIVKGWPMLQTFDMTYFGMFSFPLPDLFVFKDLKRFTKLIIQQNNYTHQETMLLKKTLKDVEISFKNTSCSTD